MRRGLLPFVVFLLSLTAFIMFAVMNPEPDLKPNTDTEKEVEPSVEVEEVIGDVSDIKSIEVDAVPENWDSDQEQDGLVLYITFYDEHHNTIQFRNTEYILRVKIFRAGLDSQGNMVKGELLYDFCCPPVRKTSSFEVSRPYGGIRIYLRLSDYANQFWVVEIEVEIPGTGIFTASSQVPLPSS